MTPQPKKKKIKKLTVTKVQDAVNKAIRERDGDCKVRDQGHACAGVLTASHFFSVGGNSTYRFYPPNIHAQCFGHHGIHERGQEPFFYRKFMSRTESEGLELMETSWGVSLKYNQLFLRDVMDFAQARNLDGLEEYIRNAILAEKNKKSELF